MFNLTAETLRRIWITCGFVLLIGVTNCAVNHVKMYEGKKLPKSEICTIFTDETVVIQDVNGKNTSFILEQILSKGKTGVKSVDVKPGTIKLYVRYHVGNFESHTWLEFRALWGQNYIVRTRTEESGGIFFFF